MKKAFFMGESGSGGGDGGYAIIKITYPVGVQVAIEFDGDTTEAPDTSGVWLYGCEENGTYTAFIVNDVSVSQEIIISSQGQVEEIYLSPQVVNNAVIYHYGDVNIDYTGGLTLGTIDQDYATYRSGYARTTQGIDASEYSKVFVYDTQKIRESNWFHIFGYSNATASGWSEANLASFSRGGTSGGQQYATKEMQSITPASSIKTYGINCRFSIWSANSISFATDYINITSSEYWFHIYSLILLKEDDISGLSDYGSTISDILSQSQNLMNDSEAVSYLAYKCTGDMMMSAILNSAFITAFNNSPNKIILQANEEWAKFLPLMS